MSMSTIYNKMASWRDVVIYIEAIYQFKLLNRDEFYVADEEWCNAWDLRTQQYDDEKRHWFWHIFE